VKVQPIEVPAISVDELREVTDNFGSNALIGEGSYGRVYYGILKNGRAAAIKKLDASKQPDDEFLAQVRLWSLKNRACYICLCSGLMSWLIFPFTGFYGFKVKT